MRDKEFDVDSLAVFLHTTPADVERMASRGKLPGRRVAGQWRFPQADIHEWFEQRIGVSDESELVEVESMLDRYDPQGSTGPPVAELLPPAQILVPLEGRTRNSAIERICNFAGDLGLLWDPPGMADAIRQREAMHSTALENGVALLHPRRPMPHSLADAFVILGITSSGIPFGGPRGSLTDIFFLLASTDDAGHLRTLTRLSRMLAVPGLVEEIRELSSPTAIHDLLRNAEAELAD